MNAGPLRAILLVAALAGLALWTGDGDAACRPRYGGTAALGGGEPISVLAPSRTSLPSERIISSLIYETLFVNRPTGPQPALVESWSANADSTQWTLLLKDGITFHDGRPLTAGDVAYSLRRVTGSSHSLMCRWPLRRLEAIETGPDPRDGASDRCVILSFRAPEPHLPLMLSCPGLAIVSRHSAGSGSGEGLASSTGPGTGPFKLDGGGSSSQVTLTAYENHREGRPFLDALRWRLIAGDDASIELQAGSLDLYAGPASPAWGATGPAPEYAELRIVKSSSMLYLAFNPKRAGLIAPSQRLRLFASIDRASILRSIIGRWGRIAYDLLPGAGDVSEPSGADGGSAREPGGRGGARPGGGPADARDAGPREVTLVAPRWHRTAGEVADRIQVDLLSAGYGVNLRKLGREEMSYKLASGEFDLYVGVWSPDRWIEDDEWLAADFLRTQVESVPVLVPAAPPENEGSPTGGLHRGRSILEDLGRDAILLPLYQLDDAILLGPAFVPAAAGPNGVPDMAWSWLRLRRE